MKFYLFTFLLIFPFSLLLSQVGKETNNTNVNTNTVPIPMEVKAKALKKKEAVSEEEVEAPSAEKSVDLVLPSDLKLEKDSISTITFDANAMDSDAQRASYISNLKYYNEQRTQRSFSEDQKERMDDLLRNFAASKPESYESYLFYYLNGQNDLMRSKALLKAQEMKPTDELVQKEMLTYYVLTDKEEEKRQVLLDLSQKDVYPESTEAYGEDMVNSVPQNSTLITHGKEDSYAAMYAQSVKRERPDVQILSLDWLTSPQYRTNLKAKGWILPEGDFVDTKYFADLCSLNKTKSIAISLTVPKEYLLPILDKLYISGLVLEYIDVPTDLSIRNEQLWENSLNKKLIDKKDNDLVNNYLPMLMQMKKYYQGNGDTEAEAEIDIIIKEITTR